MLGQRREKYRSASRRVEARLTAEGPQPHSTPTLYVEKLRFEQLKAVTTHKHCGSEETRTKIQL